MKETTIATWMAFAVSLFKEQYSCEISPAVAIHSNNVNGYFIMAPSVLCLIVKRNTMNRGWTATSSATHSKVKTLQNALYPCITRQMVARGLLRLMAISLKAVEVFVCRNHLCLMWVIFDFRFIKFQAPLKFRLFFRFHVYKNLLCAFYLFIYFSQGNTTLFKHCFESINYTYYLDKLLKKICIYRITLVW